MQNVKARLYVGNLNYETTDLDLKSIFAQYGTVVEAKVILDRDSKKSKGFGFVEFESAAMAEAATELNGQELQGWKLVVNFAREKAR